MSDDLSDESLNIAELVETPDEAADGLLVGWRIAIVGKLAGMSRRETQSLVRRHGGAVVEQTAADVSVVVIGEAELPLAVGAVEDSFDDSLRQAIDDGNVKVLSETQLWQRLGLVESEQNVRRLYTPAMLAELAGVPVAIIRRWRRRGLIVPVRLVSRLPYFDFQEVATARRLAQLLSAGISPKAIEKKLAALARFVPGGERALTQLSVIVEGKHLLLRQGDGLLEAGGQLRFDFDEVATEERAALTVETSLASPARSLARDARAPLDLETPATPSEMVDLAGQLEDEGHLESAADMYRAALAAGGPSAEICFLLAEALYQLGELSASRERYYMAVELDEDYVEARANLGCVLAECGQLDLAVAAFEGALAFHNDYADVHYHLARTLDALNRGADSLTHWKAFVRLAPDSPWADEARERLGLST